MRVLSETNKSKKIFRKARSIAAKGLVNRENDLFRISSPSLKGKEISYKVWRNKEGKIRCSCAEFENKVIRDSTFRCEHILAVKFALKYKNTEPALKKRMKIETQIEIKSKSKNATVSLESKGGEQKLDESREEISTNGQVEEVRYLETNLLADKKGEKNMKQETLPEILLTDTKEIEHIENSNNVLGFPSKLRQLRKSVNPKLVKTREGWCDRRGNTHMVDYVEWHTVADILDETTPNWTHSVKDIRQIGNIITVTVAIMIDGITREGIGTGVADSEMGIKKAEHDALKRASVKFGIARELYKRESDTIKLKGAVSFQNKDFPTNPIATSLSNLVTAKQLGMIRVIAGKNSINAEKECKTQMNCSIDELSKKAASALITHLQEVLRVQQSTEQVPMRSMG